MCGTTKLLQVFQYFSQVLFCHIDGQGATSPLRKILYIPNNLLLFVGTSRVLEKRHATRPVRWPVLTTTRKAILKRLSSNFALPQIQDEPQQFLAPVYFTYFTRRARFSKNDSLIFISNMNFMSNIHPNQNAVSLHAHTWATFVNAYERSFTTLCCQGKYSFQI